MKRAFNVFLIKFRWLDITEPDASWQDKTNDKKTNYLSWKLARLARKNHDNKKNLLSFLQFELTRKIIVNSKYQTFYANQGSCYKSYAIRVDNMFPLIVKIKPNGEV